MKRLFLILALMLVSVCVPASVYVVHDTEESLVRSFVFQLSERLPDAVEITPVHYTFFGDSLSDLRDNILITVGLDSFRKVCLSASEGVVMATFIGKEEYQALQLGCSLPTTAIFSGAPLAKRFNLLKDIWGDKKPFTVLHTDNLKIDQWLMMDEAAQYGFELQFLETKTDRMSLLGAVNFALENSEAIFSLVDCKLYGQDVVQEVLRLLFRKQKVIIGHSIAFVRAGSLLAIYSSREAKLNTLTEYIEVWLNDGTLKEAAYPDRLSVRFNPYLIKLHSIVLPSASYLKDQYDLCSDKQC